MFPIERMNRRQIPEANRLPPALRSSFFHGSMLKQTSCPLAEYTASAIMIIAVLSEQHNSVANLHILGGWPPQTRV